MTLLRCYTDLLDSFMTKEGFLRKGRLYYRMNGDILQGVALKATNPYSVCYTYFPYWTYSYRSPNYGKNELSKGFWAEIGEDVPGVYCKKELTQADEAVMQTIFQVFSSEIVPMLNSVCDLESYFRAVLKSQENYCERALHATNAYESMPRPQISGVINLNQYALLYQAAKDQSYCESDNILSQVLAFQEKRERHQRAKQNRTSEETEELILDHIEMLKEICPDMTPEEMRQDAERIWGRKIDVDKEVENSLKNYVNHRFSVYLQQQELNDFAMIGNIYTQECEAMKHALNQAFPKLVF